MFSAQQVTGLGFGLVIYIIIYAIFLVHLVMSTSKETKLIQRYSKKKDSGTFKFMLIAIVGGIIAIALVFLYIKIV